MKTDLNFRIATRVRDRIKKGLKSAGAKKSLRTIKLIGCTYAFLRDYIASKFTEGMSWENYGQGKDKWHIDHILPLCSFDLKNEKEQKKACHYSNLQPLWQDDNLKKGGKY
jgi:hypothetical protein